jgi:hypothetical protein
MDFKSLLNKLDSMDAPVATPQAPTLPAAVQLNEAASLRVLSGRSTVIAEAAKMKKEEEDAKVKSKKDEKVDEAADMKDGEKKKSSTGGTIEKTKTGLTHSAGKNYSGKAAEADKKKTDESTEYSEFKAKFMQMVEAKKADKKKPMKEAKKPDENDDGIPDYAQDGKGPKDLGKGKKPAAKEGDDKKSEKKGMSDKQAKYFGKKNESIEEAAEMKDGEKKASSTGGTIEKTKTGLKHHSGKNYSGKAAEADKKKTDESVSSDVKKKSKKLVKESAEPKMSFRDMMKLVVESGGQQQIDPIDKELFAWATRVARTKLGEGMKAEVYAGMTYERMGGTFQMYDVLSEDQK